MSPRVVFVAGAHTEIGKTHVACALLRSAREASLRVDALKPVVSGFDPDDWAQSDSGRLLAAMGVELRSGALDRISPWRYRAPLAPPMAARAERASLALEAVMGFCRGRIAESDAELIVVEGVGGLMSPIADDGLSLDLLLALAAPSILVGGAYLGGVSHTLTALEVLRSRGAPPAAVIVSECDDPAAPDFLETAELVCAHAAGAAVIPAARQPGDPWAARILEVALQ